MFKNIILYKLITSNPGSIADIELLLGCSPFVPCAPTQEKSMGWVSPRGNDFGVLAEFVDGQIILKLQTESRAVPKDAIEREFTKLAARLEAETGRKPGKKESRELKDQIKFDLLPKAFTKVSTNLVWIDRNNNTVVVEANSQAHADAVVSCLVQSLEGTVLQLLNTMESPAGAMTNWLMFDDAPRGFSIDRACDLKAADESKAVVRYGNHSLDIQEIKDHIAGGKLPTKLALTWSGSASFVLTDTMQIKSIALLDVVFETQRAESADGFDADVAIATGVLSKLINDLVYALGGEPIAVAIP